MKSNFNIFAAKIYKMAQINDNYLKLQAGYLFPEIGRRVREFQNAHPQAEIIKMGIGDVTQPLAPSVITAFHEGVEELSKPETFKGYGPEQGYDFLREAIAKNDYKDRGRKTSIWFLVNINVFGSMELRKSWSELSLRICFPSWECYRPVINTGDS